MLNPSPLLERQPQVQDVVVLAYWYPPENESGAARPFRFCKYLSRYGYRTHVIAAPCASDGGAQGVHRTVSSTALVGSSWKSRLARLIQRIAPYNDRLEWLPDATDLAKKVISKCARAPVIISTSPPVATHLVALILKKHHNLAWIADFRDPIVGNPFRTRKVGSVYDRWVERKIVEKANAVIVNTDAALEAFQKRYPELRHKIHLIWNGYDPEDQLQAEPIPQRNYKVIAHLGSIYGGRHPGIFLDAVRRLVQQGSLRPDDIKVRLVGSVDPGESWLGSPSYTFLAQQGCLECTAQTVSRSEAHKEMSQADYLLLLDLNELSTGLQVPAKLFEYVRIGRPILALTAKGSPVERILMKAQVPHVCIHAGDQQDEIDRKVLKLFSLSSESVTPGAWFREQYDSSLQTKTLSSLIDATIKDAVPLPVT